MGELKTREPVEWASILMACGVKAPTAVKWAPAFSDQLRGRAMSAGEDELDDFLGQMLHECSFLERVEEGLYYSTPGRLMAVWPTRFPTLESEQPYRCMPQKLANFVYGGRLGNVAPDDGWTYRGRGCIMVTGRANYAALSKTIGVDLVESPSMLSQPAAALRASIAWWEKNLPDSVMGDLVAVTKRVNGGTVGLVERRRITAAATLALA